MIAGGLHIGILNFALTLALLMRWFYRPVKRLWSLPCLLFLASL